MFIIWIVGKNLYKTDIYSYTGSNRMKSSVIEDHREPLDIHTKQRFKKG